MKRRNFCKSLVGAAVAAALPASAMHNILIHKGNPATFTHDGIDFKIFCGANYPFYYQREALRQMNFYQQGARAHIAIERGLGKTYLHKLNFAEIETRVLAALETKQKRT